MDKKGYSLNITLQEVGWFLCDDCTWFDGWTGLSSGDIYIDNKPFGTYTAAWYPNLKNDIQMIVTAFDRIRADGPLQPTLSIAVVCPFGQPDGLVAVPGDRVPWTGDGILFETPTPPDQIDHFTKARIALRVAPEILRLDHALNKYTTGSPIKIAGEGAQPTVQADGPAFGEPEA